MCGQHTLEDLPEHLKAYLRKNSARQAEALRLEEERLDAQRQLHALFRPTWRFTGA